MANERNLIPNEMRTPEQRRENARKAGKASGESRRKRKAMRESMEWLLNLPPATVKDFNKLTKAGFPVEEIDNSQLIVLALFNRAKEGDVVAIRENGLFKQITITFNPWNEHHWIKKRFFDTKPTPAILAITTNYTCNEWLDEADLRLFEEMYERGLLNHEIYEKISNMGYSKEKIIADCASPKDIVDLRGLGLGRIRGCRKGKDSINNGIQFIQGYRIYVHPRCVNYLKEISNYTWDKDKTQNNS